MKVIAQDILPKKSDSAAKIEQCFTLWTNSQASDLNLLAQVLGDVSDFKTACRHLIQQCPGLDPRQLQPGTHYLLEKIRFVFDFNHKPDYNISKLVLIALSDLCNLRFDLERHPQLLCRGKLIPWKRR